MVLQQIRGALLRSRRCCLLKAESFLGSCPRPKGAALPTGHPLQEGAHVSGRLAPLDISEGHPEVSAAPISQLNAPRLLLTTTLPHRGGFPKHAPVALQGQSQPQSHCLGHSTYNKRPGDFEKRTEPRCECATQVHFRGVSVTKPARVGNVLPLRWHLTLSRQEQGGGSSSSGSSHEGHAALCPPGPFLPFSLGA